MSGERFRSLESVQKRKRCHHSFLSIRFSKRRSFKIQLSWLRSKVIHVFYRWIQIGINPKGNFEIWITRTASAALAVSAHKKQGHRLKATWNRYTSPTCRADFADMTCIIFATEDVRFNVSVIIYRNVIVDSPGGAGSVVEFPMFVWESYKSS